MHILQLLPRLSIGGVERGVVDLAKGLIARGHRVSVVSAGGPLVEPLTRLGAAHYPLPVHEKSLTAIGSCIPAVARLIRATDVDVVHARSRMPAWVGFAASRLAQRPFVTTAHGFYTPHPASRVMVWGRLVIVPSAALGEYLVERFGLERARLRLVPRGVDLDTFTFQPSPPERTDGPWRIGCIGRLSRIKGQDVALRACQQLIRRGRRVKLVIAGDLPDSPERRSLEALIRTLRLGEAVEWLGVRRDIPELLASLDCVVVPSVYPESFGRSVIEAQAVGRPVVASRLGALPELIEDGESGLLVPPRDPEALADAVERLMTDAALRARCVERGRRRVESAWSAQQMVDRTVMVYDECLTQPRVLIWKLSAMGDVILSTPSLRAVRRRYPKGRLTLIVGRSAYEIVARCPYLDDIILYDPARKDRGLLGHLKLVHRLRREWFDLSIDLQNSRKTHLLARLAGVPVRVGYRRKFGWLLNRPVRLPRVILGPIAHQQHLLRQAGIAPAGEALELWPSAQDEEAAAKLLGSPPAPPDRVVGVHPGGSGRWKTKRWDLDRWARLCDALGQRGIQVVVAGGPDERELGQALCARTSVPPRVVIGETTLMELACLIKRCRVFLAHDSSSLHVAVAVGTPAVALFGPTDPARHLAPTFNGQAITKKVFCSPCYSTRCWTVTHACMQRISVEDVLTAVMGLLADTERPSTCASSTSART